MERVPGMDVSRWQGQVAWQKARAADFHYVFIRATIGDDYVDPRFYANWDGAREAGFMVSAYHVVTPNRPAEAQVAALLDVLDDRRSDLPLVVDVERRDGTSPPQITSCVRDCLRLVHEWEGRRPIVYTARWYWNQYVLPAPDWREYDLWVASYTRVPVLPRDWETWRFWQYSEQGRIAGVASTFADLNWFAGSYEGLLAYAGMDQWPAVDPPTGWKLRVTIPKLNIRSGPGLDFEDLGDLHEDDVIEVLKITGDDVWVHFEPGKWAALSLEGERYLAAVPVETTSKTTKSEDHSDEGGQ